MTTMLKSHPVFAAVRDEALVARPVPTLGQVVHLFAPRVVHTDGEPFPKVERNLITGRVFHVGPVEKGWEGLGNLIDIIPDAACVDRLDHMDRNLFMERGYISRTMIGTFYSVDEAARRERYIDAT